MFITYIYYYLLLLFYIFLCENIKTAINQIIFKAIYEINVLPCLIEAPATFHGEFGKGPKKPCTDGSKPSDKIVCTAGHSQVRIFWPMENVDPKSACKL